MANPPTQRGVSGVAWPGLVVLLGSICAFWLAQNELTTSRPEPPPSFEVPKPAGPEPLDAVFSRMWEDPISATFEHWKSQHPGPLPEDPEKRKGILSVRKNAYCKRIGKERRWFADLVDETKSMDTLCLPILVDGGPYAENKETRLRTRFAVVTALAHAGYRLLFPDRMSYAVVNAEVQNLRDLSNETFVLPVKLYRKDKGKRQILVLWINESQMGVRPLLTLHRITDALFGGVKNHGKLSFRIIGPSSSDGLKTMYEELKWFYNPKRTNTDKFTERYDAWLKNSNGPFFQSGITIPILSPRATATGLLEDKLNLSEGFRTQPYPNFQIFRTIGNDHLLISHAIQTELKSRGVWPNNNHDEVMVLLTEHDTSYGDRIVKEFTQLFPLKNDSPPGTEDQTQTDPAKSNPIDPGDQFARSATSPGTPLRVFRYLRGIDGQTAGESAKEDLAPLPQSDDDEELYGLPSNRVPTRRPYGKSQYDYLRRFKYQIQRLQERYRVTAIGVMGSDVYDKLLILRALRPHFPDTVFFTTDVDAIYEHSEELHHTRNLVIASHFGLQLNQEFHNSFSSELGAPYGMLPFRDSYQTSEHLATRIAIGDRGIQHAIFDVMPQQRLPEKLQGEAFPSQGLQMWAFLTMVNDLWNHADDHVSHDNPKWEGKKDSDRDGASDSNRQQIQAVDGTETANQHWPLEPIVMTVGNNGFRQLQIESPHAPADRSRGQEPSIHLQPVPASGWRSFRAPATVLVVIFAVFCFLGWDHRLTIFESLQGARPEARVENRGTSARTDDASAASRGASFRNQEVESLLISGAVFLRVVVAASGALIVSVLVWGAVGPEAIVLDGTSVMPRMVIQTLIGFSAALTLLQFSRQIGLTWNSWFEVDSHQRLATSRVLQNVKETFESESQSQSDSESQSKSETESESKAEVIAQKPAVPSLGMTVVKNLCIFASFIFLFGLFVLLLPNLIGLLMMVGFGGLGLAIVWMMSLYRIADRTDDDLSKRFVFFKAETLTTMALGAALFVGALAICMFLQFVSEGTRGAFHGAEGWRPYFMSRGGFVTWSLDFLSMVFCYAMLCLLFTAILYGHEWSREFTRYLDEFTRAIDFESKKGPSPDDQVDSLIVIGEATQVTTRYTPWLLVYILSLLLAYHPLISPVPIPTGILVLLSLAIAILVASTLYMRRVIHDQKARVMIDLRGRLFTKQRENAIESESEKSKDDTTDKQPEKPEKKDDKQQKKQVAESETNAQSSSEEPSKQPEHSADD